MEVFATTVDGSYSLTVVVGVSVWGVVGVVIPWGGRLVLPFCVCVCVCVCVCSNNSRLNLCNCYSYCCFLMVFLCYCKNS